MKKINKWQVAAVAILAIIVVARIKLGRPLGPVALEAYRDRDVLLALYQGAAINILLAVLGFLPLAVSVWLVWWVSASRRMSTRWQTCFSGKAYRLRERWSAPVAFLCGFVLFKRQSLVGLAFMIVGLAFFWAIGPGKVVYKGWLCDQQRKRGKIMRQRRRWMPTIDTQSPEFEKWATRIWVIAVVALVITGCWYGGKAYVGYRQQQQPPPAQQAAVPEAKQTAEVPGPVQPFAPAEIPVVDSRDLRTVLARNEAMQLAQVTQEGGPVDLREQVGDQSSVQDDQSTSSTDGGVQDLRKFVHGKADKGGNGSKKATSQSKKSTDWTPLVVVLLIIAVLAILCFVKKTKDGARTIATVLIGFVAGYGLIWLIFGPGKLALIVGLIGAFIFYRLHQGLDLPDVIGGAGRVVRRFKHARESGQNTDHQPPLSTGGTTGGDS